MITTSTLIIHVIIINLFIHFVAYQILGCLHAQCGKKDLSYKTVAIEVTGKVIDSLKVDNFEQFYTIVSPLVQESDSLETVKADKREAAEIDEEKERKTLMLELRVVVFRAVGVVWPRPNYPDTQGKWFNQVWCLLVTTLPNNNWRIQVAILNSLTQIMKRLK